MLDAEKLEVFFKKIESFPIMWNSLETTIAAYYKKPRNEWICLSIVFYASEKYTEPKQDILYEIPGKFEIVRCIDDFSLKKLKKSIKEIASGSIIINNKKIHTSDFETIDSIKERRPHWQREGLVDKEGWPAIILRNYAKDNLLDPTEWAEIDELAKKHLSEPHSSLAEVSSKHLGIEIYGGKLGAIYGVIPIYLKLEEVKFKRKRNLLLNISAHNSIKPTDLHINIEFKNSLNETESIPMSLIRETKIEGNIWIIKESITNKINAIEARLFVIFNDNIIFEDWAQREDIQKKLTEKSEIKLLPQKEDELRDKIVIPLLNKMNFKRVEARAYHGPGEFGADILPFYKINEFGIREYYAAQIKTKKLRGGTAGALEGNIIQVLSQFDSAMSSEWKDVKEGISFYLDHFIIVALYGATQDAEKLLFDWPSRRGKRHLIYLTGRDLLELIQIYNKSLS